MIKKMIPSLYPNLDLTDLLAFFGLTDNSSKEFEQQINDHFLHKYSFTFYSGRAALFNILKAHQIIGKDVLVTAYTCSVVTEAITQSGNRPKFIDTCDDSINSHITMEEIEKNRTNLGAVIITNLYGISDFCTPDFLDTSKDFLVILDDALSPDHLKKASKYPYDYVTISCGVRKPFTCLGGGIAFTNNVMNSNLLNDYIKRTRQSSKLAQTLTKYFLSLLFFFVFRPYIYNLTSLLRRRTHLLDTFFSEKYHDIHEEKPEYFLDMLPFQKRIGIVQLKKFDHIMQRRKEISNTYHHLLASEFEWVDRFWRMDTPYSHIPFLHPRRKELEKYLLSKSIDVESYFDYVIPYLQSYREFREMQNYPNAERLASEMMNLPINIGLDENSVHRIVDEVLRFDKQTNI